MKTKFTKGEWRKQKYVDDIEVFNYTVESDLPEAKYFSICDVYGFDNNEAEANAKLIAAAPDLLNAILEFKEFVFNSKYPKPPQKIIDSFEQAIKKAIGE